MNNRPENNLDYSSAKLDQYSDNTLYEVMPEKIDDDTSTKYVLIKHDYYSTDSDHGRSLLQVFLSSLSNSPFTSIVVYLIDKGILLLDESNPLFDDMRLLLDKANVVIADQTSANEYGLPVLSDPKISFQPSSAIAEDIIYLTDYLTLE